MNEQAALYKDIILRNGLHLTEGQLAKLDGYCNLLLRWNAKLNLVSRKDQSNLWPNHILHSLSVLFEMAVPDGAKVVDIGTGGGLPGIPLSIARPHASFVLIESIRKKCLVLEGIVQSLGLVNVEIVNARAEDIASAMKFMRSFDIIVARAVAPLRELIGWSTLLARSHAGSETSIRLLEFGGNAIRLPALIAWKGGDLNQEITEARKTTRPRSIQSHAIHFDGIDQTGLIGKQFVVVEL